MTSGESSGAASPSADYVECPDNLVSLIFPDSSESACDFPLNKVSKRKPAVSAETRQVTNPIPILISVADQ